jgi:opacity protein-like surface antigen
MQPSPKLRKPVTFLDYTGGEDELQLMGSFLQMRRIALSAALLLGVLSGSAEAADGLYFTPSVGVVSVPDQDFEVFAIPGTLEYKTGWSLDGAVGYRFGQFRIEAEIGYARFGIGSVRTPAGTGRLNGDMALLTGSAGAYYDLPFQGVVPFLGGGVGFVHTDGSDIEVDPSEALVFDKHTSLMLHGDVGIAVPVSANVELVPAYRYSWTRNGRNGLDDMSTHTFRIGLRYQF